MTIAFDFDGCWTADPNAWAQIAAFLEVCGHTVVMVTNRPPQDAALLAGVGMPIVFAAGRPKRAMASESGYTVDVWIDDNPILVDYGAEGIGMVGVCH